MGTKARLPTSNGFALSLFTKPLLYLAGLILLSRSLAVTSLALAQTIPHLDASGWTVLTPVSGTGLCSTGSYTGTCIVYVSSSSGNDLTCASVPATSRIVPCRTLHHAISLLRNAHPDWLLLKRGDTFPPDSHGQNFGRWTLNGASATEPMVIGSYDPSQPGVVDPYVAGARPLIENAHGTDPLYSEGNGAGQGGDYLAIVGLEFYDYTDDPNNPKYNSSWTAVTGVFLGAYVSWSLIEDCKFSFYGFNVTIEPDNNTNPNASTSVATFNRNVVVNAYGVNGANSSGIFVGGEAGLASAVANFYMTGNIFDHNGWNTTVSGAGPTTRNHNIYMECVNSSDQPTNSFETITNNILTNDSEAPQFRLPGTYTGNLLAYVPNGLALGATTGTDPYCTAPPTTANATNNVILNANFNSAVVGGGGFGTNNLTSPANITNNVISTYASTSPYGYAIQIATPNADNVFTNNTVWGWANLANDTGGIGDVLTPNNYNCTTCYNGGAYPDPYRSLGSYYAANLSSLGVSLTFTNSSSNIIWPDTGCTLSTGQIVTLSGSPPTNFSTNRPYYVVSACASGNNFILSATPGGTAITAGSAGGPTTATVAYASITGTINNCSPSCSGSTTAGNVLNVTAVTAGTLNVGDAITYSRQGSQAIVITGNSTIGSNLCGGSACTGTGGTGTYAVNIADGNCTSGTWSSCTAAGAIPLLVSSQTLTDYSPQSLITAEHSVAKNNLSAALAVGTINSYIAVGFGINPF